jgi:colanic acid/amylovoran biosynthesis glycosyltransferase
MRIAYLINQYPKVSHSFIRREIMVLEQLGFEIVRIALRGWADDLVDEKDLIERNCTRYVLREGAARLFLAMVRSLLSHPISLIRALVLACRMGRRSDRPLRIHLIYLAEACLVVALLRKLCVQHLHAHFGTNSAEVAMLAHVLGGPEWSFTVHGPEEFDRPQFIGLGEKIRHCAFVVAISSYTRSQLYRWSELRDWSKIHVVRCGLEKAYFLSPTSPVLATKRLVCVGRLCEQKGQILLIEAVHQLALQGVKFELVLVGDGEMRGDIEALVARYKLQERVRITGWLSGEQVRHEILAARALVLPSFAEGLPVVIMEAMALGRPVISTYVAGIPELVEMGESGWLLPAGDVQALAAIIEDCLDTSVDAINRMGSVARKTTLARHCLDNEAHHLTRLFRSVTEAKSQEAKRSLTQPE